MTHDERYRQAKKVTLVGAVINAFLGLIKVLGGWVFYSHSLFADGIHSFADLISDVMVVFASKYGSQAADDSHPYGHGRIETAATMLLSLFLILAGCFIGWDALLELWESSVVIPTNLALPIAIFSIAANEALYHYTRHVGLRIQSELIVANAWHHRSDAASSLVVVVGLIGTMIGYKNLDAIAAMLVALMIVKMGVSYGWNSIKELVDTAVDEETLTEIKKVIASIPGVVCIHQLRSRMMAGEILIDVHIQVSPKISVSEGHYIAQHVHHSLVKRLAKVRDVTVHVDPEDDETCSPSVQLPSRAVLEQKYFHDWQARYPEIRAIHLHYLDGVLHIDVFGVCHDAVRRRVQEELSASVKDDVEIDSIQVLCTEA